jgi:hypothetical protein
MGRRGGKRKRKRGAVKMEFNRSVRVEAADFTVGTQAGALLLREIEKHSGFLEELANRLHDPRKAGSTLLYSLLELIRTRLMLIALGHPEQDAADRLRNDEVMTLCIDDKRGENAGERTLPSQPTMSRLIDTLAMPVNREHLVYAPLEAAISAFSLRRDHRHRWVTIDLDCN